MVFAGFGISEPKLGYDDYRNLDVKGKTVVVLRGAPENFSSSAAAHVTNILTILKSAAAHGAIGVLMASADTSKKNLPDLSKGVISVLNDKGKVVLSKSYQSDKLKFYGLLMGRLLNDLLSNAGKINALPLILQYQLQLGQQTKDAKYLKNPQNEIYLRVTCLLRLCQSIPHKLCLTE